MIKAFVGHSFELEDEKTINKFKEYFNSLTKAMEFKWGDAQERQIKSLSEKVKQKMEGKNLFIGIITKKHIEIEKEMLIKPKLLGKDKYTARIRDCKWGASYWIIQESGYAIAKEMKVLFLIERGIRELKGLQADIEHIPFTGDEESKCFPEINQALGNLLKEIKGEKEKPRSEEPPTKPKEEPEKVIEKEITIEEKETEMLESKTKEEDYDMRLSMHLFKKEEKEFNKLKEEILDNFKGNHEKTIEWKGKILHLESQFAKKNVLDDLEKLCKESPNSPSIYYWIACELEKYDNYEDAAIAYLNSAKYEANRRIKLLRIGFASEAYARNEQADQALNVLYDELHEELPKDEKHLIYKYLSDTTKILKDDNLFTIFSEKALLLNASNDGLRFDLAYKYDDMDKSNFALYHYKILIKSQLSNANLNNLGVAYSKLEMKSKSVKFYKAAIEKGSTLSMANLAQRFLNEGFIDEANNQLKNAMKYEDYEKDDVGRALARIESVINDEEKEEEKVLKNIEQERQFKIDYADAYSMPFMVDSVIDGEWTCKHGNVNITLESGNVLKGIKEELVPESAFIPLLRRIAEQHIGLAKEKGEKPTFCKKSIYFEGDIVKNRTINYKIKIEIQPSNQYLPKTVTETEFSGIGIVNKEMTTIKVMEVDKDKKQSFYELAKK